VLWTCRQAKTGSDASYATSGLPSQTAALGMAAGLAAGRLVPAQNMSTSFPLSVLLLHAEVEEELLVDEEMAFDPQTRALHCAGIALVHKRGHWLWHQGLAPPGLELLKLPLLLGVELLEALGAAVPEVLVLVVTDDQDQRAMPVAIAL